MDSLLKKFGIHQLPEAWQGLIREELSKSYLTQLLQKIDLDYQSTQVYPAQSHVFEALKNLPMEEVKVIILGQDPYHGKGQANGLAFSVKEGVPAPPSLKNIFKELENEYKEQRTKTDLSDWSKQGVLLLNAVLTVKSGQAGSHKNLGWERFTDTLIQKLSDDQKPRVFLLWGSYAIAKGKNIDQERHLVLTSPHPSPLSSYRGFFGNNHFLKTNKFLEAKNRRKIKWI